MSEQQHLRMAIDAAFTSPVRRIVAAVGALEAVAKHGTHDQSTHGRRKWKRPQFKRGQKVRTPMGKTYTVVSQRGLQVFVEEMSNGWIHPGNLTLVEDD
ncbi:MAG: hypothetical protein ACYC6T_08050 [Thermoleophilia bacterium]